MNESAIAFQEPKKRRIWVTVILTFLGFGLPSIYCGNLRAGIFIEISVGLLLLSLEVLTGVIAEFFMLIILIFTFLMFTIGFLVYNIKLTQKTNRLNTPRINKMGRIILLIALLSLSVSEGFSLFVKWKLADGFSMASTSMENKLFVGDYLIVTKGIDPGEIQNGDIVIFKYPGNPRFGHKDKGTNYLKRVIAIGGQTIKIVNKQVFVDGEPFDEPPSVIYITNRVSPHYKERYPWGLGNRDNMPETTVPEGKLFVLGDNRDNSSDSRYWGYVNAEDVIGKARFIHFSWDSENNRIRWERLGLRLDN